MMRDNLYKQLTSFLADGERKSLLKSVDDSVEKFSDDLDRALQLRDQEQIEHVLNEKEELRRRIKSDAGLDVAMHFDKIIRELTK